MFDGLSEHEKSDILSELGNIENFDKGDELYRNGALAIILNGKATVKRQNDIGDSITIRAISSGELFGAASVFGDWKDGKSSIIANTSCEILYISEENFCKLIKIYPQISINYIEFLSGRIRFLNRKLDAFTAKTTEERLYEFLLSLSDSEGNIALNFGMAELARRLNVGRTSIYRDIDALQSKKLIKRDGHNFKIRK